MAMSRKDFLAACRERIATREWLPGSKLPTSARLAVMFDVSESLVNQAMATLIDSGEIESVPGGARYVPGGPRSEDTIDVPGPA